MESNYKHKVLHLKMSASHTEEFDPWNFEVLEELSKFCQQILQELSEKKIYLIEIDNARS
jgi:methionine synthase II (cobalamin-independent)